MGAPLTAGRPHFAVLAAGTAPLTPGLRSSCPRPRGRAALLLPVFPALLPLLADARPGRALALMFPAVILLSTGGTKPGSLDRLPPGVPLAALAAAAGPVLILIPFVPRDMWKARLRAADGTGATNLRQRRITLVLPGLVRLWLTEALPGLGMATGDGDS